MSIYESYAKRQQKLMEADKPVTYQYDEFPIQFRVQVKHILDGSLGEGGNGKPDSTNERWQDIRQVLLETSGRECLTDTTLPYLDCIYHLFSSKGDDLVSFIEVAFIHIDRYTPFISQSDKNECKITNTRVEAIEKLNYWFKEYNIGYEYIPGNRGNNGAIIRINSQFLHSDVVEPVFHLLSDTKFASASKEFMKGHQFFRHGDYESAIIEVTKAFESTMKIILSELGYTDISNDTASRLIDKIVKQANILPAYTAEQLHALKLLLSSGVVTVRNKESGHGAGTRQRDVEKHTSAYAIHSAASNIIYLVEAYNAK